MIWPGQHQGHIHLASGGEGGSAQYCESQSQCIHLLVGPPGIDHISANSVNTCCMYEVPPPLPHLSPSCSIRSEQPSDARVGPRKAANSHNIPCCPTLSEANICQTKLEGIPQKDAAV